jgi:sugar transferase EpsL
MQSNVKTIGKRLFDLAVCVSALIFLSPVLLVVVLLVRYKLGSPALFRQQRPGLGGQPFWLLKFRTMTDARDAKGVSLPDSERLTAFGRFLRSSSLDELPELFNVLKGDMSLVGPRPLLMQYMKRYTPEQARRHEVKPGITGWAQVNGFRGETDTIEKMSGRVAHDLHYIDNWSLPFDLYIIALTVTSPRAFSNAF